PLTDPVCCNGQSWSNMSYMDREWPPGQHKEGRQTRRIKQREGCVGPDEPKPPAALCLMHSSWWQLGAWGGHDGCDVTWRLLPILTSQDSSSVAGGVDGSASRRLQRPDGYWERDAQQ
ncbi:Glutamate receptor 3, partial [Dissostichus eleginoides]